MCCLLCCLLRCYSSTGATDGPRPRVQVSRPCGGDAETGSSRAPPHSMQTGLKEKKKTREKRRETKSMGFVWPGNSGGLSPPRPLSHLSLLSSTPRANKQPCVATAGLELHRPCVRLRWTTRTETLPPHPPPPTQLFSRLGPGHFSTDAAAAHLRRSCGRAARRSEKVEEKAAVTSVAVDAGCQISFLTVKTFF